MVDEAQDRYSEIDVIMRCIDAAIINFEKHVKLLEQKNIDVQAWAADVKREQGTAGRDWEAAMSILQAIYVSPETMQFLTGRDFSQPGCLLDLFNAESVNKAGHLAHTASSDLDRRSQDVASKVDHVLVKTNQLYEKIEKSPAHSAISRAGDVGQLLQDIEAILTKIENDHQTVHAYPTTPKNISQASKTALLHTRNFLPNLLQRSCDMYEMVLAATQSRNAVAAGSLDIMQGLATLTSLLGAASKQIETLELDSSSMDALQLISTLHYTPVTYASFLIEGIKRQEWNEKIKSDSETITVEMVSFKDEEVRRRKKWQKSTGAALWGERVEQKVLGLEITLQGGDDVWPTFERQDIDKLLEILKSKEAESDILEQIRTMRQELDNPTKQQSKRVKAFKNGSVHDATLGRSGLLIRGDNEVFQALQDDKAKVELKLKTAESRVRRLEDLLHRQSHIGRPASGTLFHGSVNPDQNLSVNAPDFSPRPGGSHSRRSSASSRRYSANISSEDKQVQLKLLTLEAELTSERERSLALERAVTSSNADITIFKGQVEDLQSTKRDLLENFEAQQREFGEERRSLEAENQKMKNRLEEIEDEMDRFMGSREHERIGIDERVQALQDELDTLQKSSKAELQRAQGQVDFLRNDAKLHRESKDVLEKQLQRDREDNVELKKQLASSESLAQAHHRVLTTLFHQTSPGAQVPEKPGCLHEAVTDTVSALMIDINRMRAEIKAFASFQNEAQASAEEARSEFALVKEKLTAEQRASQKFKEDLASETATKTALQKELEDNRNQLSKVRAQISDGESGSETLRIRLEEEERKVTQTSAELAASHARSGSLEEELRSLKDALSSAQDIQERTSRIVQLRSTRAEVLTQRIYAQNDKLCRLLERLSYTVIRDGASMTIQRMPKPDRSSINASANDSSDPSTILRRSLSASTRPYMTDSTELESLNWTSATDLELEARQYELFMQTLGNFDTGAFCDTVTKRIKDIEYTAKKYSKDARGYREKAHAASKDALEKIAYRHFKDGDLALFLPTRNQSAGAWAAFNVGAPHYFLRELDSHRLRNREWLLARIHKIEERVVDLSKSMAAATGNAVAHDGRSSGSINSIDDDNPFDLSDGLRWFLVDATEEKGGAPTTPGLSKSTVAAANIAATANIHRSTKAAGSGVEGLNKTLSKSLESRRGSNNSRRSYNAAIATTQNPTSMNQSSEPGTEVANNVQRSPERSKATSENQTGLSSEAGGKVSTGTDSSGNGANPSNNEVRTTNIDDLIGP